MNVLFLIGSLVGIFCVIYSMLELYAYLDCVTLRGESPEIYRKKEIATDLISILHNIYFIVFGLCIGYFFLSLLNNSFTFNNVILYATLIASSIDYLAIAFCEKKFEFSKTKYELREKWKKQKKFDNAVHNAEVEIVKDIERVDKYKIYSICSLIIILIINIITLV